MPTFSLKKLTLQDIPALARLAAECFTETFGHLYAPEDLSAHLQSSCSEAFFAEALAKGDTVVFAESDGQCVGYGKYGTLTLPAPNPLPAAVEIHRLYVLASHHKSGIGHALMQAMLEDERIASAPEVYLSVWSQNAKAQHFYRRHGFEICGSYIYYVGTHADDERIMVRRTLPLEWRVSSGLTPYAEAVAEMEQRVQAVREGVASELLWLVEHPPLYTAGTSAKEGDLLAAPFPVHATGRGGQYTYHGPGQRVVYVLLDVQKRMQPSLDLRRFVWLLEEWIIRTLASFGVQGERREGRVGIWVAEQDSGFGIQDSAKNKEAKIAALGIRIRRGVSYHGLAINLNPDLSHYAGIIPCGIREHGVTSLAALGKNVSMEALDAELQRQFALLDFVASS